MTRDPVTIAFDASIGEAYAHLRKHGLRRAPVIKVNQLVGVVTKGDLLRAGGAKTELRDQPATAHLGASVATVMSHEPVAVTPATHLEDAARLLLEHRIGALPVVEDGRLVGIVTDSDLLRVCVHQNSRKGAARLSLRGPRQRDPGVDPVQLCLAAGLRLRALSACDVEDAGEILTLHVEGDAIETLIERLLDSGFVLIEREEQ